MTLDELIDFDVDVKEIEEIIERTTEEIEEKVNWTNAWGKNILFSIIIKQKSILQIMQIE